ncbi:MAG: hypothetical protein II794_08640 [Oscillospiraceae bacterium]|nr:hypothetical protein [Oscillospiraceae bacterium]
MSLAQVYSKPAVIEACNADFSGRLGLADAFAIFMNLAGEHAEKLGVGIEKMISRDMFWLTVRTRVRFRRRPRLLEPVTLTTWPEKPGHARCNRDYLITSGEELLVEGKTEWSVLRPSDKSIVMANTVFPPELSFDRPPILPEPFMRLDRDFSGAAPFGTYTVKSTDIDVGGHMNNTRYAYMVVSAFSTGELGSMEVREMEISFRHPAYEGQTLTLRRRDRQGAIELEAADSEGTTVMYARLLLN